MFTESLGFWELLVAKNQDIQKLLAFQGAFEKLFNVIESEGGVESRVNVESALTCVDTLLRFNSANQVGCDPPFVFLGVGLRSPRRITSARAPSQPFSFPFSGFPLTYPHRSLHLNILLSSSGTSSRRETRRLWWG